MDNECLYKACYGGIVKDVKIFLETLTNEDNLDEDTLDKCLFWACKGNQHEVINILEKDLLDPKKILEIDWRNWNNAIRGACEGGIPDGIPDGGIPEKSSGFLEKHLDLVKYIINKLSKKIKRKNKRRRRRNLELIDIQTIISFPKAFESACKGSSLELVKLMNERCSSINWGLGFENACKKFKEDFLRNPKECSMDIIKFIEKKRFPIDWDRGFSYICESGSIEAVRYVLSKGSHDWTRALEGACKGSSLEIVNLIISSAPENYQFNYFDMLYYASQSLNIEIIKFIISKGYNNWDCIFENACYKGSPEIVNLILSKNPVYSNIDWGLISACRGNNYDIVKLMLSKGAKSPVNIDSFNVKIIEIFIQNNMKVKKSSKEKYKEYIESKITTSVFLKKNRIPFHIANKVINEYF